MHACPLLDAILKCSRLKTPGVYIPWPQPPLPTSNASLRVGGRRATRTTGSTRSIGEPSANNRLSTVSCRHGRAPCHPVGPSPTAQTLSGRGKEPYRRRAAAPGRNRRRDPSPPSIDRPSPAPPAALSPSAGRAAALPTAPHSTPRMRIPSAGRPPRPPSRLSAAGDRQWATSTSATWTTLVVKHRRRWGRFATPKRPPPPR